MRKKILLICGSINQTTQMHQITDELPEYDRFLHTILRRHHFESRSKTQSHRIFSNWSQALVTLPELPARTSVAC